MKKTLAIALSLAVSAAFAAAPVKSKKGPLEITKDEGGGGVVCTVDFTESMSVLKSSETAVLVKSSCGQGWAQKSEIIYVDQAKSDKSMQLEDVDIVGWLDNPTAVFVLDNNYDDVEGVNLDRDFKEYLVHTVDRENIEQRNQEN
jgi:opacity protein-like surface antigen